MEFNKEEKLFEMKLEGGRQSAGPIKRKLWQAIPDAPNGFCCTVNGLAICELNFSKVVHCKKQISFRSGIWSQSC